MRRSVDLTVVTVTLSWALLVDALGWNFLVYKPPQHDKVSFIKRVNVKLFSNALGQLYIYFLVILMYFRFTSGEERLWQSLCKKCPNKEFFWSMFSRIQFECGKIPIRKNSVFGHFSRIGNLKKCQNILGCSCRNVFDTPVLILSKKEYLLSVAVIISLTSGKFYFWLWWKPKNNVLKIYV